MNANKDGSNHSTAAARFKRSNRLMKQLCFQRLERFKPAAIGRDGTVETA
jgi:hypothetical protein